MSTVCTTCGHDNPDGAEFCGNRSCGAYLSWDGSRRPDEEVVAPDVEQRVGAHLELAPTALSVSAGETVATTVTVHNTGTVVERFRMTVDGPPAGWAQVDPVEVVAYPGTAATATVRFALPETGAQGGTAQFVVRGDSVVHPELHTQADGTLTVERVVGLVAELAPQASRGGAVTTHQLRVTNTGNGAAQVWVTAADRDGVLGFDLPPNSSLEPGGHATPVHVRARPSWIGRAREHPFRVTVAPAGGTQTVLDGTRTVRPRLPIWLVVVIVVAIVVLGLASAAIDSSGAGAGAAYFLVGMLVLVGLVAWYLFRPRGRGGPAPAWQPIGSPTTSAWPSAPQAGPSSGSWPASADPARPSVPAGPPPGPPPAAAWPSVPPVGSSSASARPPADTPVERAPVSSGSPSSVSVPYLVGAPGPDAERILVAAGLRPRTFGSGSVVNQRPDPGTSVPPGTTVDLIAGQPAAQQWPPR